MDPHREYPRRQRRFRQALVALGLGQAAFLLGSFAGVLPVRASLAGIALLLGAGGALLTWGVRWVRAAQPRVEVTPAHAVAVARARTRFVRRRGVLGFGLLWGVTMATWNTWDAMPAHTVAALTSRAALGHLAFALVLWIPAGLVTGYVWGRLMWRLFVPRTDVRADSRRNAAR